MVTSDGSGLIFILSTPRAGSTLLGVTLGNHSQVLCPPEPWLLLPLRAICSSDVEIIAAYDHGLARKAWCDLASNDIFDQAFRRFAATIYNSLLEQAGKRVMVDKTPRYYHILPWLEALFPQAFKIWLRRNPLDVIASCKETWKLTIDELFAEAISPHSFDTTIGFALLADYFENDIPTQYTLRYEDLVQDPLTQIESLCKFVGLPFEESMVNYGTNRAIIKTYAEAVMGDKKVADYTRPHTGSVGRWREALTFEEIKQSLLMLGRATFVRHGYRDVMDEAADRIGLDSNEIDENGKLARIFEHYAAYLDSNLPDSIGGQRTLIERDNARLSASWADCEADRVARLAAIEDQGRRLSKLEAERNALLYELADLRRHFANSEADRAARLEVIQRQGAEIDGLHHQLRDLQSQWPVRALRRLKLVKVESAWPSSTG
jgi:protein-tyrosine sulfotransferase